MSHWIESISQWRMGNLFYILLNFEKSGLSTVGCDVPGKIVGLKSLIKTFPGNNSCPDRSLGA